MIKTTNKRTPSPILNSVSEHAAIDYAAIGRGVVEFGRQTSADQVEQKAVALDLELASQPSFSRATTNPRLGRAPREVRAWFYTGDGTGVSSQDDRGYTITSITAAESLVVLCVYREGAKKGRVDWAFEVPAGTHNYSDPAGLHTFAGVRMKKSRKLILMSPSGARFAKGMVLGYSDPE